MVLWRQNQRREGCSYQLRSIKDAGSIWDLSSPNPHLPNWKLRVLTTRPPGKSSALFLSRPQAVFCMQSAKDHTEEFVVKLQTSVVSTLGSSLIGCDHGSFLFLWGGYRTRAYLRPVRANAQTLSGAEKLNVCRGGDHHHHYHHRQCRFHSPAFVPQTSPGRKGLESSWGLSLAFSPLVQLTKALVVAVSKRTVPLIEINKDCSDLWPEKNFKEKCSR